MRRPSRVRRRRATIRRCRCATAVRPSGAASGSWPGSEAAWRTADPQADPRPSTPSDHSMADSLLNVRSACALGVMVPASLLASCGSGHDAPAVTVRVDPSHVIRPIPRSFLGLSTEWDSVEAYAGPAGRRNVALRALLAQLVARTGGLALRVGGDTADQAWWNPRGRPRPPKVLQDVTPATLDAVSWLARTLGGPVTLDVNLPLGDPSNARTLAAAARRRLPRGALDTIEIGNEPDLYTRARRWRVPGHLHVRVRK